MYQLTQLCLSLLLNFCVLLKRMPLCMILNRKNLLQSVIFTTYLVPLVMYNFHFPALHWASQANWANMADPLLKAVSSELQWN